MEAVDPDDIFKDDEDDSDGDFYQREATKELVVYLVDASPKMFTATCSADGEKKESHFHVAVSCIAEALKTQIINRSYDEVAICFFNTREKRNLQDLNGVFIFNVAEREYLDRPTARLIKDFDRIEESFMKEIGSQYGIVSGSRENSLYNVLWVAQALLRKGSAKTADKRMLLFTNESDPFGGIKGAAKTDMTRTTLQRARDAQDLGISIELLPLSWPDEQFNVSLFYADLIGLDGNDVAQFLPSAGQKLDEMKDQLRKRMFSKRIIRRVTLSIATGLSIELNTYALIRPTIPGAITWLDSVSNRPLKVQADDDKIEHAGKVEFFSIGLVSGIKKKDDATKSLLTERSYLCADTGALMQEPAQRYQPYKNEIVKFSVEELAEIKRVSMGQLHLLGFKPLSCLKDYHNIKPSTFVFPSDKEVIGSTCVFVALHKSMLRLKRFAVAFYGSSSRPQLVALVAQDEIISAGGQVEPPGMHMIYLPYSDDIRQIEELHSDSDAMAPKATDDQIKKASALIKRIDLKDFSVCQFANPALQRHYAVLQALALEEDEMPDTIDETLPDEEGMARPGVSKAIEEFKLSVYGDKYDEEVDSLGNGKASEASRKRKAVVENAVKESANYDWADLADSGKLKDLSVVELKYYLTAHNLPVSGKKEALISRILTDMGK